MCARSLQLCLTLCSPINCNSPGFFVHEILQARILEGVTLLSGRGSSRPRDQTHISCLLHWPAGSLCCGQQLQSWPTLCNPMDCSLPASSVKRILQARLLEWVAMPSSKGSSRPRDRTPGFPHYRWILYLRHQGPLAYYNNSSWSIPLTASKEGLWPYAIVTINLNSFYSKV